MESTQSNEVTFGTDELLDASMMWAFDYKFIFNGADGVTIAEIDLQDGTVTVHQPGRLPEAAKLFWDAIRNACPINRS